MTITTKVTRITPSIARAMLERNHLNTRPLNRRRIIGLAQIMRQGGWRLTHQGIALDPEGNILDGQHRLYAVVEADTTVQMMVTSGMDPADFAVIDVGKPRTVSDILTISGFKDTSKLGAALRMVYVYKHSSSRPWPTVRLGVTPDVIRAFADDEGERMSHLILPGSRIRGRIKGSAASYTAALFIIDKWAEKHSTEQVFALWLEGLESGVGLPDGDPRLALAHWVNGAGRLLPPQLRGEVTFLLTLRAWHAHIKEEKLTKMTVRNPQTWFYSLPE
jgi:hypothetical protein